MAKKDEVTLLTQIAQELKKLNRDAVRQNLENKDYQERQLALQSGDTGEQAEVGILSDADDFKRRVKASMFTAKMSERFTDSGKRAKHSVKKIKVEEKQEKEDKKLAKEKKKLTSVNRKDKRVGLFDLNKKLEKISEVTGTSDTIMYEIGKLTLQSLKATKSIDKWTSLVKVNSDKLVHDGIAIKKAIQSLAAQGTKKGSIFTHDIFTEKQQILALKQQIDESKQNKKNRQDDKRSDIEAKREKKREKIQAAAGPMNISNIVKMPKKAGILGSLVKLFMLAKALPYLLGMGAVALATGAIKDFIAGWKEDGLAGAIGKGLGGHGSGMWNAIKQSFKLGGLGAIIGAAIGTAFFGVGAIPGAIIGGLIGMAIGAITGFFGGEKITEGLKGAGKVISDGWNKATGFIMYHVRRLGEWFYKPGGGAAAGPHGSGKTEILGGFISWEPGNFSIGAAWTEATDKIWEFVKSIGKWIYDGEGEGAKILGGTFTMPAWFDNVELGVAKVWEGLKGFAGLVKSTLIRLLPDWLTDHLGWTVDGKVPDNYYRPTSSVGGNVKKALENPGISVAEMAEKTGYEKVQKELGAGYMVTMDKLLVNMDNLYKYGMPGSKKWKEMLPHIWAEQRAAMGINTLGVQDLTHKNKTEEMKLQLRKKEESGLSYYDGKQRQGKDGFVTHSNQDFSQGKGAVTVIQHLYADGSPTVRTVIHDYHTSKEYLSVNMMGMN